MSRLTDLLAQARNLSPQLAADLEAEVRTLTQRRTFGLVFEPHQPEAVQLPHHPVRRGNKVRVLPPRGETKRGDQRLWRVQSIHRATKLASIIELDAEEPETKQVPIENLVVVAEFQDTIFPGLVETGRVERGGDKPFHTVINAENFHALELLTYTHRHRIDAIYIDPPYNTGAKDWKYNNDYVASDDSYRHSKWLAMMKRRILLAKELISESGTIVITIDEHEVHRLGVLLDDILPGFKKQTVTIVNNPKGVTQGYLSRVEEYAIFCFGPSANLYSGNDDLLTHKERLVGGDGYIRPRWKGLLRSGDEASRTDRERMFYPIWIDKEKKKILYAGEYLPMEREPDFETLNDEGLSPVWPVRSDGSLGRWGVSPETLNSLIAKGYVSLGRPDIRRKTWGVSYLSQQIVDEIEKGIVEIVGYDSITGVADVAYSDAASRRVRTVWHRTSHDAGAHGTDLVRSLLGAGRPFPFPKALYAVEDALRILVRGKPEAIILDFFSGSGTTAHAVMRLNRQDGGRRQCISVTNNEVGADEQKDLLAKGLRPGDKEWERKGICDYITKPRIKAAITGETPDGKPIQGDYKFTDEFPMAEGFEENAAFFTLTYEAPLTVSHHKAFERIAPLLWLRAGAEGRIITDLGERGWDVSERYGVLQNLDDAAAFLTELEKNAEVRLVYVITDDDTAFQMVCRDLPSSITSVRLYESYLQNFRINSGRMG